MMKNAFSVFAFTILLAISNTTYAQMGAGAVGGAVKAEAVNENLNDTSHKDEATKDQAGAQPKKMHIKRRYIVGAGGLVVVVVIVAVTASRKRKKAAANS